MVPLRQLVIVGAPLTLVACDKDDIGFVYYIVAAILGSVLTSWIIKRYKKGYKASMENVARKYHGEVVRFGDGAGYDVELQGAHNGHRFTFKAEADGKGSKLTLRIMARPNPAPLRVFVAAKDWWQPAAKTFGLHPNVGQQYQDYIFVSEPPNVAAVLFNKPEVHAHLQALHRSIPLSLFIGPTFVDYCLTFEGQKLTSQPKFYSEEILSWWIEEMVAFAMVLEQP